MDNEIGHLKTDGCGHSSQPSRSSLSTNIKKFNIDNVLAELKSSYLSLVEQPEQPYSYLIRCIQNMQIETITRNEIYSNKIRSPSIIPTNATSPSTKADLSLKFNSTPQDIESAHIDLNKIQHYFGVDIGGSLCKITFFESNNSDDVNNQKEFLLNSTKYGSTGIRDPLLSFKYQNGVFHFVNFETRRMEGAFEMLQSNGLLNFSNRRRNSSITNSSDSSDSKKGPSIMVTGGGAYKYSRLFLEKLQLHVNKKDELNCLLAGLNFFLQAVPDECYFIPDPSKPDNISWDVLSIDKPIYPYLLVNIGSGVSILRVDSASKFTRVSGTCIGGGTYLGLCRLLTKCNNFNDVIELANLGNAENVDMLVGDIYGGDYTKFGLKASTVASAFGKILMKENPWEDVTDADVAVSLLNMISANISQLAYQSAVQQKVNRILFAGNFLRNNKISMSAISFASDYWSRGEMKALFLKHEGYCGSLGAFLLQEDSSSDEE